MTTIFVDLYRRGRTSFEDNAEYSRYLAGNFEDLRSSEVILKISGYFEGSLEDLSSSESKSVDLSLL